MFKQLLIAVMLVLGISSCARNEALMKQGESARHVSLMPPGQRPITECTFCAKDKCNMPGDVGCECMWMYTDEHGSRTSVCYRMVRGGNEDEDSEPMRTIINEMYDTAIGYGLIPITNSFAAGTPALSVSDWHYMRDSFLELTTKGREWVNAYYAISIIAVDSGTITSGTAVDHYNYWSGEMAAFNTLAYGDSTDVVYSSTFVSLANDILDLYMLNAADDPNMYNILYLKKQDLNDIVGMTRQQVYDYYD